MSKAKFGSKLGVENREQTKRGEVERGGENFEMKMTFGDLKIGRQNIPGTGDSNQGPSVSLINSTREDIQDQEASSDQDSHILKVQTRRDYKAVENIIDH